MPDEYDFVVIGGGSAGAVIASRLSEDPSCQVALIEAGERPPEVSALPIAPAAMQLNPATDWMFTADPGKAGLGLNNRRMPVPRGKMLGGSSGINYMVYVRGNPGDFDAWAEGGATGWSYAEVLPYFKKSEGLAPSPDIVVDAAAHNREGPLGVSVRDPILPAGATIRRGRRRRHSQGRLQWPRPPRSQRGRVVVSGLPPTYISVGGLDLFLEENMVYADRVSRAGVPVELHVYPRAHHGFHRVTNARVTKQAEHDTREALRRFLHG